MGLVDRFERLLDRVMPPPDEAVRAVRRGVALLERGDVRAALACASEARRVAPSWPPAMLLAVDALEAGGSPGEALAVLDAFGADADLPTEALGRVVALAAAVGDVRRAHDVERASRGRPARDAAGLARRFLVAAERFEARGEVAAAVHFARAAVSADPASVSASALLVLARAAAAEGDVARAGELLARAVAVLDPSDGAANAAAGSVAAGIGRHDVALRCLRRAWICGAGDAAWLLALEGLDVPDDAMVARARASLDAGPASVLRALEGLRRGAPTADLDTVHAADVPDGVWSIAIGAALAHAPATAARWAREAPERLLAPEVRALDDAPMLPSAAAASLALALRAPVTQPFAAARLTDVCATAWGASVDALLAGFAAFAAAYPASASAATAASALRAGLDAPVRLAILGEFSAGKSSVVNRWTGAAVSAVGVLPTTARVIWVRRGVEGGRVVDGRGGLREGPIEALPRVLAAAEADGAPASHVELFHPSATLADVELLDTPGSNAAEGADPAATARALELADLALWVFDASQAGKATEREAIAAVERAGVPVLPVLHKIDRVGAAGADIVARTLAAETDGAVVVLAAMSARTGEGWDAFTTMVRERVIERGDGWKRLRATTRLRSVLEPLRADLEAAEAADVERRRTRALLVEAIAALRRAVSSRTDAIRREVRAVMRDRWSGLRGAGGAPSEVVLRDLVGELSHRVVERERALLAKERADVVDLAERAGVVGVEAAVLLTAPADREVRAAVHDGVRDAVDDAMRPSSLGGARPEPPTFDTVDPWGELLRAVDDAAHEPDASRIALRAAVRAAERCVSAWHERLSRGLRAQSS